MKYLFKIMDGLKLNSLFFCLVINLVSCTSTDESNNSESNQGANDNIVLSQSQFTSSNMEFVKLSRQVFSEVVKANGMFEAPPENIASVSVYFGGYVKTLSLLPGQQVKKGEVLFILENPEYVQVQQDLLEARGQLKYLKSDYERQKKLVEDGIASEKKYLKAEADYLVNLAKYESQKKKLTLMGMDSNSISEDNITTTIAVRSPISGYVTDVDASIGLFLSPGDVAVTIINPDHLHVELIVFEKDLPLVKIGQQIKFKLQSNLDKEYLAKIYLVNKSIDSEKRTSNVHGHLLNDDEEFIPGMYIEAEVVVSSDTLKALPQDAVVNIEEAFYVLTKSSADENGLTFEKREVKVGQTGEDFTQIINHEEFDENTEFLTTGAFNLIQE